MVGRLPSFWGKPIFSGAMPSAMLVLGRIITLYIKSTNVTGNGINGTLTI